MSVNECSASKNIWFDVIKGALTAFVLSAIFVLVLALVAKIFALPVEILPMINQVLKAVAVLVAVSVNVKCEKFLLKGVLVATIYSLLSLIMFVVLGGTFSFAQFALDWGIAIVVSLAVAVIKSRKQ